VRYETDQFVELKANPDYRRGRPKLDGMLNRYFKNTAGAVAALRANEIQFSYVEADEAQAFAGNNSFNAIQGNSWVLNYLGFNHAAGMWGDVRVRRAVLHAINRDAIVKSVLKGAADVANSIYIAAKMLPNDLDPYTYDPAIAKVLLQEAGWDKINGNKPLALLTYYNNPLSANVLAAIQAMLGQVGVNVVPRAVDVPTYNSIVYAREPDATQYPLVYAGAPNGPDPGIANLNLNEKQIPPAGADIMRVRMPALNTALDGALAEPDDAKRIALFQQVAKVFNSELPWAPLWVQRRYGIVAAGLHNFVWTPSPSGGSYDQHAETWAFG
jgi:peptide/nickel transport system substrate-binding protein